jgi:hypothetical protein
MDIQVVLDDPKAYTKPVTYVQPQNLMPDTELIEYLLRRECQTSGRGSGPARFDERRPVRSDGHGRRRSAARVFRRPSRDIDPGGHAIADRTHPPEAARGLAVDFFKLRFALRAEFRGV